MDISFFSAFSGLLFLQFQKRFPFFDDGNQIIDR